MGGASFRLSTDSRLLVGIILDAYIPDVEHERIVGKPFCDQIVSAPWPGLSCQSLPVHRNVPSHRCKLSDLPDEVLHWGIDGHG